MYTDDVLRSNADGGFAEEVSGKEAATELDEMTDVGKLLVADVTSKLSEKVIDISDDDDNDELDDIESDINACETVEAVVNDEEAVVVDDDDDDEVLVDKLPDTTFGNNFKSLTRKAVLKGIMFSNVMVRIRLISTEEYADNFMTPISNPLTVCQMVISLYWAWLKLLQSPVELAFTAIDKLPDAAENPVPVT